MNEERYFIIDQGSITGDRAVLRGDEFHHLVRVVRAKIGREVTLLDGRGGVYSAVVARIGSDEAVLDIRGIQRAGSSPAIDLALAALKAPRLDLAVEKCTEIGIGTFIIFSSQRSVWRSAERGIDRKRERLERKAIAACKQSGQAYVPSIEPITGFSAFLSIVKRYGSVYVADHAGTLLLRTEPPTRGGAVLGIVGPEGGFTDREREGLLQSGAVPVSLGSSRLRSETAAICLLFSLHSLR
jgi:16S rRNA (uracil1498-N3)-methyltransferase